MAAVEDLELAKAGVALDIQGFIATDRYRRAACPGSMPSGRDGARAAHAVAIAAAGGCRTGCLAGRGPAPGLREHSTVIFGRPPLGTVGLTEKAARERHGAANITVFRSSFVPLYHALTTAKRRCEMKLVTAVPSSASSACTSRARARTRCCRVCGGGAHGSDKKDFDDTVAIHPTSAEELVTMR